MRLKTIALLAIVAWTSSAIAQENLLTNPDFEEPFGSDNRWRAAAVPPVVFERTDEQAFSGSWSGRASNRSQQWHGPFYGLSADGLFGDGGWFQIRVRAKADDTEGQKRVRLLIQIDDEREQCPAELPLNTEFCFCYDLTETNRSCAYGADSAMSDSETWVELEWTGPIEFMGEVNFYQFQIDTLEGEPFPDLYVDNAELYDLTSVFGDRFEADDN
ncbi:MAG: hypothetical protein V2J10_09375 [Wenzhouxiangella sp.]|jgi:hypothetical protein|nr:hypothetical protein [Wenzhouxiangella sp.]